MRPSYITPEIAEYINNNYKNEYGIVTRLHRQIKSEFKAKFTISCVYAYINKYNLRGGKSCGWTDGELEILNKFAGNNPFKLVVKRIQNYERKKGLLVRSENAIRKKCINLELSVDVCGNYYSLNILSKLLGVSDSKIERWIRNTDIKEILAPIYEKNEKETRTLFYYKNIKKFVLEYRSEISEGKPDIEWMLGLFAEYN